MAEEAEEVLRQDRRERDRFIAFHASWLLQQGIIEARCAGSSPPAGGTSLPAKA